MEVVGARKLVHNINTVVMKKDDDDIKSLETN